MHTKFEHGDKSVCDVKPRRHRSGRLFLAAADGRGQHTKNCSIENTQILVRLQSLAVMWDID